MKRSLLFIFTLLTITLSAVAQPRISSNKETHHFGQIEWKRPVSVEYAIDYIFLSTRHDSILLL